MHNSLTGFLNARDEMDPENCFLCLKNDAAETEEMLHDAMPILHDVLESVDIDALVVVDGDEGFLDAVDPMVGDDDHVQKISVEAREKFELQYEECTQEKQQNEMSTHRIVDVYNDEEERANEYQKG